MAKTKFEEMFDRLPTNIKETEVLELESKKILAALLELLLHSEARESKVIYASNSRLRELSGINKNMVKPSIDQLQDYGLITRKKGKPRREGEKSEASEYTINFKKLKEPLVKKTFDDWFGEFYEDDKSLEKPINPPITTTITTTTPITNSNTITTSTKTSNSIAITKSITTPTSTESTNINNKYFEEFKKNVKSRMVGSNDKELLERRTELMNEVRSKEITIGSSLCRRCECYINREYEEAIASM